MKFFTDLCTLIGGVWLVDKAVKGCIKIGEVKATCKYVNTLYKDLTVEKKESE